MSVGTAMLGWFLVNLALVAGALILGGLAQLIYGIRSRHFARWMGRDLELDRVRRARERAIMRRRYQEALARGRSSY